MIEIKAGNAFDGHNAQMVDHANVVGALTKAVEYVAETRRILERQHARIAELKAAGASTSDAERALEVYNRTLSVFEGHERILRMKMH